MNIEIRPEVIWAALGAAGTAIAAAAGLATQKKKHEKDLAEKAYEEGAKEATSIIEIRQLQTIVEKLSTSSESQHNVIADRLARVETTIEHQSASIDRIDTRLNTIQSAHQQEMVTARRGRVA